MMQGIKSSLSKLTLSQKGIFFLSVSLFVQISFVFLLVFLQTSAEHQIERELHSQTVVAHMNKVSNLWSKLGVEFPRVLTYPDFGSSPISFYIKQIHNEFDALTSLLEKNGPEKSELNQLRADTDAALAVMAKSQDAWYNGDKERFSSYLDQGSEISKRCLEQSNKLLAEFTEEQQKSHKIQATISSKLTAVLWSGLTANVFACLWIAYMFVASIAHRVNLISSNSDRLVHGIPLHSPLPGDDEIARLDQTFHQMADALTEAARKEQAVIQNAQDVICTLDGDGVFLTVNSAASTVIGRYPPELIGRVFVDFVVPEDRLRAVTTFQNLIAGDQADAFEISMIAKGHRTVNLLVSAHWSEADKSLFCVMHDVTQRRAMERTKRQFVAMITHDLRSPLNSVFNTLEAVAGGIYNSSSAKGQTRIQEAEHNIDRMLGLISDLLEMGKFDAATLTLVMQKVSMAAIVNEAVGSVSAYAEQQLINLKTETSEDLVEADKERMVQVLINLLSNAVKFSPPGSTVRVTTHCGPEFVRLEVTDSGRGISTADQKIIFEPYKQAKPKEGEQRLEGTGLGLTICKSIVEAHHGTIGVVSAVPKGTTFWIEIPLVQPG